MAFAVLGVVLISLRHGEGRRRQSAGALPLAALAAVAFGITFVAVHRASQGNLLWGILFQRIGMVAAVVLWAVSAGHRPTASWKAALPVLVTVGILDLSGTTLFALASVIGLVGLAAVLASLHPVSTIIMARIVAHEQLNQIQRAGIGATLLGVALISAAG
jgi:drug/metabolite transporter (DMT)-like permease